MVEQEEPEEWQMRVVEPKEEMLNKPDPTRDKYLDMKTGSSVICDLIDPHVHCIIVRDLGSNLKRISSRS